MGRQRGGRGGATSLTARGVSVSTRVRVSVGVGVSVRVSVSVGVGVSESIRGIYEATAAEKDFILAGFTAAHATAWLEGQPDPRATLKDFAAACTSDDECKSNVCVARSDGGSQCSHGCLDAACPQGYACTLTNARMRCGPMPPQAEAGPAAAAPLQASGGCAASPTLHRPLAPNSLLLLALLASWRLKRRARNAA